MRLAWPFTVNVLLFASGACIFPFFVLYYQSLGFSGPQIGLISGITPLITLVSTPLWTNLADTTRRHRLFLTVLLVGAAGALLFFPVLRTFGPVLLLAITYSIFSAPIFSFLDSATMNMLGNERELYGRVRMGGTIGFGVAALFAGQLAEAYGLGLAFWIGGSLLVLAALAVQPLNHHRPQASEAKIGRVTDLLKDRRWLPFLLIAFAGGLAVVVSNSYLFSYMEELGASRGTMGLALTIGTIAEVPIFFFGDRLIKRFTAFGLLVVAMLLTGARLLLFVFADTPTFVLLLQFLSGLMFPAMWLAGVAYADELAPPGLSATAQGLFGAFVFGFGSAVGGFAAGPLLASLGGRSMFLIFGLIIMAIVLLGAVIQRRMRGKAPVVEGPEVVVV